VPDPKAVPFGPFLVLGALEVLFFPDFFARLFARLVSGS
jgi:prepilin signal peptidase PulO-like enzyme (type II secretory pathway)